MNKFFIFIAFGFAVVLIAACSPDDKNFTVEPITSTSTPEALSTAEIVITSTPAQPSGFPFAPEFNNQLQMEDMILGAHVYGDNACYDLGIYSNNTYQIISCLDGFVYPKPIGMIEENESLYLNRWLERFASFDESSAHGILRFNGIGAIDPDAAEKLSMEYLISGLEYRAHAYVSGGGLPSGVLAAKRALAQKLETISDSVTIHKFEAVDFPDSCLGVPKVDEVCDQIVTPGFIVLLVMDGMLYEYHTDFAGFDVRPFGEPQIAPTPDAGG